jgi:hypothetical protein
MFVRNLILGISLVVVLTGAALCAMQTPAQEFQTAPAPYGASFAPQAVGHTPYPGSAGDAQLAQEYVKADKEDAKKDIRKKLAESLSKQFDQHLQHQQRELDDLEKQIVTLKEVIKKRQTAKNEIVERRIDQLVREAEGLGWNAPGSPHMPRFYGPPGATAPGSRSPKTSTGQSKQP